MYVYSCKKDDCWHDEVKGGSLWWGDDTHLSEDNIFPEQPDDCDHEDTANNKQTLFTITLCFQTDKRT
jgi:hypothetical protein